jgi:hypothetical protein
MNYFSHYSERELHILGIWVKQSDFLPHGCRFQQDNTPYHDAKVILPDGTEFLVQVKEEEEYWFAKTGNIGLDYISAFRFKTRDDEHRYLRELNFWVPPEEIATFLGRIEVDKWGKLITCDAHVHIFYVGRKGELGSSEIPLLLKTYCNNWLRSERFIKYLTSRYRLRINDKRSYDIDEPWHSAAFFLKPSDPMLKVAEIDSFEKLLRCIHSRDLRKSSP